MQVTLSLPTMTVTDNDGTRQRAFNGRQIANISIMIQRPRETTSPLVPAPSSNVGASVPYVAPTKNYVIVCSFSNNGYRSAPLLIPMGQVTNQGGWTNNFAGAQAARAAIAAIMPS